MDVMRQTYQHALHRDYDDDDHRNENCIKIKTIHGAGKILM